MRLSIQKLYRTTIGTFSRATSLRNSPRSYQGTMGNHPGGSSKGTLVLKYPGELSKMTPSETFLDILFDGELCRDTILGHVLHTFITTLSGNTPLEHSWEIMQGVRPHFPFLKHEMHCPHAKTKEPKRCLGYDWCRFAVSPKNGPRLPYSVVFTHILFDNF